MSLGVTGPATTFAQEAFRGLPNHSFPLYFRISVDITNLSPGMCAGFQYPLTASKTDTHYGSSICADGSWQIQMLDYNGNVLATPAQSSFSTQIPSTGHYEVAVTYLREKQTLMVNDMPLATVEDTSVPSDRFISLAATNINGSGTHFADFSQFSIEQCQASTC
jgi:hypothetical protein